MKIFLLFIILITFSNCTEDLSNNTPGFEASVDGKDWVAQSYNATVQNNQLSISGNNLQIVTIICRGYIYFSDSDANSHKCRPKKIIY